MRKFFLLLFLAFVASANAATRFVDGSVGTSGNGQSWATAWKTFANITGLAAGDVVEISGGPSGSSLTYSLSDWNPIQGSASLPITYKIGQDSAHNGTAIFSGSGSFYGLNLSNTIFSGDAGDGQLHFQLNGYSSVISRQNAVTNWRFSYVNIPTLNNGDLGFNFTTVNNIEIDHVFCHVTGNGQKWVNINNNDFAGFDNIRFHHITLELPFTNSPQGFGQDGFGFGTNGVSVYNCFIKGYLTSYTGNQHADGLQWLSGNNLKIYNNVIASMGNAAVYGDNFVGSGNPTNVYIYNNIILGPGGGGIQMGNEGSSGTQTFTNCYVVGNVTSGTLTGSGIGSVAGPSVTFTNCMVANEIAIDVAQNLARFTGTVANNVQITSAQAPNYFVNFVNNTSSASDFHLKSTAPNVIGVGSNLTSIQSFLAFDKDGVARPASGGWDIGAYQFGAAAPGPPVLSSATINPAGNQVALVFDQPVQAGAGGSAGWTLNVSPAASLGTVSGVGSNTLTYNLTRTINQGETLTLTYAQPGNGIEAVASGTDLASITTPGTVTNNSTQGATATPQITLAAGPYFGTQSTTITDTDSGAGAVIHYTVDGSTPTGASPTYSAPISIATNQSLKAIATWTGHVTSGIASSSYEVISWTSVGTAFKTFAVPQQTGTFTWNVSATAPAAGSDVTFGLGPAAVSAFSQMAVLIEFNNNTINAFNGGSGTYTAGPAYTPGAVYNFVAVVNMTAHTWTVTVTPAAGGTTSTIVTNVAFRAGHTSDSQLSWVGMSASSGTLTLSNMAFPVGAASARYIGLRGVPAAGGAVP